MGHNTQATEARMALDELTASNAENISTTDSSIIESTNLVHSANAIAKAPSEKATNVATVVRRAGMPDPRIVFPHRGHRTINRVLSLKPGDRVVGNPIPPCFDEDFAEAIKSEIVFTDDDTEVSRHMKENVIAARSIIIEEMGRRNVSAGTLLHEAVEELRSNAQIRSQLLKEIVKLKQEGTSIEELRSTLKDANDILQKTVPGAREIRMMTIEGNNKE